MILIVKGSDGSFEDYTEWVDSVWSLRKKNFNLEKAFQDHLLKQYVDAGLPVSANNSGIDLSLLNMTQFKRAKKIANNHTIHKFLKEVVKAKQLDFQDITI
jgi:hypothetical protein